jgi:AcrR family transcriptional regulator
MPRPATYDASTRAALLRAAGRILTEEGAAALTVRHLAAQVGATTSAIYALFGSKLGVVRAMFRDGFAHLANRLAEVSEEDPATRIYALGQAYRRAALYQPHLYQVMFACPVPGFVPNADDAALSNSTLMVLKAAVESALAAGVVRGDADTLTVGLWAVVHGLASLELVGQLGPPVDPDTVWDITLRAAIAGVAQP